jgi:hypothetical protein
MFYKTFDELPCSRAQQFSKLRLPFTLLAREVERLKTRNLPLNYSSPLYIWALNLRASPFHPTYNASRWRLGGDPMWNEDDKLLSVIFDEALGQIPQLLYVSHDGLLIN